MPQTGDETMNVLSSNGYSRSLTVAATLALVLSSAPVLSQESFYNGNSVNLLIGGSPGGGYDTYARLLARHMGRHIPGSPNVVPRNMHGAGGLLVANHLFNIAPKDGATVASFPHGVAQEPLFGNTAAKFNASELNWIGSANDEVSVCAAWHGSGVTTFEQARQKGLILAVDSLESSVGRHPTILNAVLGANLKLVKGYAGLGAMRLALERGEAEGICGWSWSSVVSTARDWLKDKKINVFLQMSMSKHPDLPNVPLVIDLAKTDQQRQVLKLFFAPQVMGRPFVAPPGVPSDRIKTLRAAFDATMKDEKFIADANKSRLDISPTSGEDIQNLLKDIYATPRSVVEAAIKALR
jgi:hypothetical protein